MIDLDECWLYAGYKNKQGYGEIYSTVNGKQVSNRLHRISYETFVGKIPEGLVIDHLCRNRCCINPDHLEPVTNIENILRGEGFSGKNLRKTHCPKGHEYIGENIKLWKGCRRCRTCEKERERLYYINNKEKWLAYNSKHHALN